jgi:hypothetical protein
MPEPELDRLSNIIKTFNELFGNIAWAGADRVERLVTEEMPAKSPRIRRARTPRRTATDRTRASSTTRRWVA